MVFANRAELEGQALKIPLMCGLRPDAIAALAKELLEQEATGDRSRAAAWFQKYDVMPSELRSTLAGLREIPVDVDPVQPFPDKVQ